MEFVEVTLVLGVQCTWNYYNLLVDTLNVFIFQYHHSLIYNLCSSTMLWPSSSISRFSRSSIETHPLDQIMRDVELG